MSPDLADIARQGALPLADKIELAKAALGEALDRFGPRGPTLAFTGGKDSTVLLWLAREVCGQRGHALPTVATIDEGDAFPEITAFIARLTELWSLPLTVIRNEEILAGRPALGDPVAVAGLGPRNRAELARLGYDAPIFPFDPESPVGNHLMKTAPLAAYIESSGTLALATAIRRDEHEARVSETVFSPREIPPHTRVHPILPFRERDIWDLIRSRDIPFCELYRQGYRSLGTRSGTVRNADVPAWEQDLENTPERAGRDQDKEAAMEDLRALGYM